MVAGKLAVLGAFFVLISNISFASEQINLSSWSYYVGNYVGYNGEFTDGNTSTWLASDNSNTYPSRYFGMSTDVAIYCTKIVVYLGPVFVLPEDTTSYTGGFYFENDDQGNRLITIPYLNIEQVNEQSAVNDIVEIEVNAYINAISVSFEPTDGIEPTTTPFQTSIREIIAYTADPSEIETSEALQAIADNTAAAMESAEQQQAIAGYMFQTGLIIIGVLLTMIVMWASNRKNLI